MSSQQIRLIELLASGCIVDSREIIHECGVLNVSQFVSRTSARFDFPFNSGVAIDRSEGRVKRRYGQYWVSRPCQRKLKAILHRIN